MVSHTLQGNEYPNPGEITIQENDKECTIYIHDMFSADAQISLSIKQLHDFIGTLLHVQQKLKNQ